MDGFLEGIEDLISNLNIPEQLKASVNKASNRLFSAVGNRVFCHSQEGHEGDEVGTAPQSKNEVEQATTEAQAKIIEAVGNQIAQSASQMAVHPDYLRQILNKSGERILQDRINVDKTFMVTLKDLHESTCDTSTIQEEDSKTQEIISDDFLNTYEDVARHKSSEDLQILFGRILAGEIRKPGTFSIRTLRLLDEIDQKIAVLFRRFCSLALMLELSDGSIGDVRVCPLGEDASQNALKKYGLTYFQLNLLNG